VSTNIHLVYSRKPDSISEEDYNRWYDFHLGEILVVPGFVSAHRFKLSGEVVDPDNDTVYTHLSLYEIEGDVDQVMRDLDDEAASGRMQLPDWFDQIRFASWNAASLGDRVLAEA
jgi:hypothetical protein